MRFMRVAGAASFLGFAALGCGDDSAPGGSGAASGAAGNSGAAGAGASAGSGGGTGGASGSAGDAGTSGASGAAGTGGASGSSGAAGTDGASGSSGAAGTAGVPGDGGALDPPPGSYGQRRALLEANSEMAVAEANGKIYVIGGYPANRTVQRTVQVYDIATNAWTLGPQLPEPLHHPVAVGVAGKIYSLGGQRVGDVNHNRALVLDPAAAGTGWVDLAPLPTPRGAGHAAVIDDQIYVVGGRPPAANAFEVYDISDNRWTELADLPGPTNRNHLIAAAIGGKIYVAGGRHTGGSFADPMTDALDVYTPGSGWTSAARMPRPRGGLNGVLAFGCFFTWGGEGANIGEPNNVFPDHDVYNPITNMWTSLPDLPTPIHGVTGAAFVDGLIYMPGGGTMQGGSSGSTIFQVYRPEMRCQ